MTIPIQNLYYLFSYAWGRFPAGQPISTGIVSAPDIPNLFARLLIDGVNRLLRRGLDRGYASFVEERHSPRGRMMVDRIIKEQSLRRGALVCSYDELTVNVVHNQIIKATALALSCAQKLETEYAHELSMLTRRMGTVSDVRLSSEFFARVQLSRNTGQYVVLIRLCELVHRALLPDENGNRTRFADILKDEKLMSAVFEEFLRNFYAFEQQDYTVCRQILSWNALAVEADNLRYMPTMETDITLHSPSGVIVFDAKFYTEALVERDGLRRIRSPHLYQLFAYMESTADRFPGRPVSGGLIYPQFGAPAKLHYRMRGHDVLIWTVDLDRPWQLIHDELLALPALVGSSSQFGESVAA